MTRPPHGLFDHLTWALAAWVYSSSDGVSPWRLTAFRFGMLASAAVLAAVVLVSGGFPFTWHRVGTALWLAAGLVMMRGERAWGDPRLGTAAATGLAAMIGFIAWLAILKA